MDSKLGERGTPPRPRTVTGSDLLTIAVVLGMLLTACGGVNRTPASADANGSPAIGGVTSSAEAVSPTGASSAALPAVCSPRDGKAVPEGAARVLRRYLDRLADRSMAAAQRLAAPGSAATRPARALTSGQPRLAAIDDHY